MKIKTRRAYMKKQKTTLGLILISALIFILVTGCSNGKQDPLEWNEGGKVLAKCGNVKITQAEVDDAFLSVQVERRDQLNKHPQLYADFVTRLLILKIATIKANEKGIQNTEDFKEKQKEIDAMYSIQMKSALQEMLIHKEVVEKIIITDKEARDYYNANMLVWEKIEVSEIFFKISENPTEKEIKEVLQKANKVYEDLVAGKISWNEAVAKYSDSNQVIKERNGERGVIHRRSRKLPSDELNMAAFALVNEGDFTKPIAFKTGYYIIKLDKKITFEDQKEQIKRVLSMERVRVEREDFMDSLKTAPIEYFIEGYDPNVPLLQQKPKP
ncbi:MAG TPA: hypothetical protein ENN73_04055 [Firmicutes bacterium]|nr:hypothetical protein [Bacillota bacterium]